MILPPISSNAVKQGQLSGLSCGCGGINTFVYADHNNIILSGGLNGIHMHLVLMVFIDKQFCNITVFIILMHSKSSCKLL